MMCTRLCAPTDLIGVLELRSGCPTGPHAALAIVAVACSAVSIPSIRGKPLREIEASIATLQPVAIILLKDSDSAARKAANSKGLNIIELTPSAEGTLAFRIAMPGNSTTATPAEPDEPDPDAPAFILQTSGTAAEPKLIPFSHRNMLAAAGRVQGWFNLTSQDRCLAASPVFYSHGLKVTVFTPLLTGGTVAFPSDTTKFDFLEWFSFLKPTWYSAGPTLHRLVFDQTQGRADAKTGHALRFILSGGAPLPENVLEGLQKTLGVPVVEHYGSSEAAQISANLPPPGASKPGTCGIPPAGARRCSRRRANDTTHRGPRRRNTRWVGATEFQVIWVLQSSIARRLTTDGLNQAMWAALITMASSPFMVAKVM